ncbi:MAG: F0F1 ATP synthase subunit gamma [Gallionella sp.]|nr:F0F1 ATP synthase subunit gamma [Gallionella sp.]
MTDTAASLRRKIDSAAELESVVRTMKAMAASGIGQYENAVRALDEYSLTVQLGLVACFMQRPPDAARFRKKYHEKGGIGAVVFGSDQGMVGQFNDVMATFVGDTLRELPGKKTVWAVGERIQARMADIGFLPGKKFTLPNSIGAITQLTGQILLEMEALREKGEIAQIYIFHHRPKSGAIYTPVSERLWPLDDEWWRKMVQMDWPTGNLPQVMGAEDATLDALIREFLFISLFRACAESLASENASRLASMQRAEKNINEILAVLNQDFHRLRQTVIDEELFDVIAGYEMLFTDKDHAAPLKGRNLKPPSR